MSKKNARGKGASGISGNVPNFDKKLNKLEDKLLKGFKPKADT